MQLEAVAYQRDSSGPPLSGKMLSTYCCWTELVPTRSSASVRPSPAHLSSLARLPSTCVVLPGASIAAGHAIVIEIKKCFGAVFAPLYCWRLVSKYQRVWR